MKAFVFLLLCVPAFAQSTKKIGVVFNCDCDDITGELYASAMRDLIARSPRFEAVSKGEIKDDKGKVVLYNWRIRAVSIDPTSVASGQSAAIAVVFLLGDSIYISMIVQTCRKTAASECAADALASFDKAISSN